MSLGTDAPEEELNITGGDSCLIRTDQDDLFFIYINVLSAS